MSKRLNFLVIVADDLGFSDIGAFGGESTVIALDVALTSTGRQPILDLTASGTIRPDLLVGEDGAAAITKARAEA